MQAFVLLISVGLLVPALRAIRVSPRRLGWVTLLGALPLLPSVVRAIETGLPLSDYSLLELLAGWIWTALGLLAIVPEREAQATVDEPLERACSLGITILGVGMVLKSWWVGATGASVFVTFGGHTNSVATLGVLGLCWTVLVAPAKHLILAVPAYAYLLVFSTSRAGVLALGVIWVTLVADASIRYRRDRSRSALRRSALRLLAVPACFVGVMLPMFFGPSPIYPYRSMDGDMLVALRYDDFWGRMSRFSRLLPAGQLDKVFAAVNIDPTSEGRTDPTSQGRPGQFWGRTLSDRSRIPEARQELAEGISSLATGAALGNWPVPFFSGGLSYPHNHALDMSYNFGWLPALLSQIAVVKALLASWSAFAGRTLRPYVGLVFIGLMLSAIKVQFAGDLLDSLPLALVCVIALTLKSPPSLPKGGPGGMHP